MAPETLVRGTTVQVKGATDERLFVGIGDADDVARYLAGVRHATVVGLTPAEAGPARAALDVTGSTPPTAPPGRMGFWSARASGSGTVSLDWPSAAGTRTLVVMNADGSSGVAADVAVGTDAPGLGRAAAALLVGGAVGLSLSLGILFLATRNGAPTVRC
jgi:hypothetical protein